MLSTAFTSVNDTLGSLILLWHPANSYQSGKHLLLYVHCSLILLRYDGCMKIMTIWALLLLALSGLTAAPLTLQGAHAETTLADDSLPVETYIQRIFPKATRIEPKQDDFPVWPVYQLGELLGYAFETQDLVQLPGFSGDVINLLVGIDTSGRVMGQHVLYHHEPIFLHGLGPEPMLNFIDQYTGRLVTDRIIVGGGGSRSDEHVVQFDGVTKATVSVIVINDTVLSAALQVARAKLEQFAQQAPATAKSDFFEPKSLEQLIQEGLLKRWHISTEAVTEALPQDLDSYPSQHFDTERIDQGITLYYGYLNSPMIGRNLLGEEEYQRLMATLKPGQHALAVFSEGFLPYLEPEFRPGTVPQRIALLQNGLPISLRDLNFFSDGGITLPPPFEHIDNLQLFKINNQTGFNPGAAMQFHLQATLARNPLIQDHLSLHDDYQLPAELFEINTEASHQTALSSTPIWKRIWADRIPTIAILSVSLMVLTALFIWQKKFTQPQRHFKAVRWIFLFFTLFFIGFYAQGQLSVVNIYTLLLEVRNGFSLDVFLLDPVIFILWSYTFVSLFLWGRGLFCGWLCPFGALQEMVAWVATTFGIRQLKISPHWHRRLLWLKYVILIGLVGTAFASLKLAEQLAEIEPFKTSITLLFVRYWPFVVYAVGLLAVGLFVHKFYCRYLCPLGAGLAILGKLRLFEWLERRNECGSPCQLCRRKCGIDAIKPSGEINYDECIQCLECVVILRDDRQCAPAIVEKKKLSIQLNS